MYFKADTRRQGTVVNEDKKDIPIFDVSYTANYIYLYENLDLGNFGIIKQVNIVDRGEQYQDYIIERFNDDGRTIESTGHFNRLLKVFKSEFRNNSRGNDGYTKG